MDLLISNLWLISYKLSVFIIKWGKQRIVSIQSSASEKEKTPLLGQPACPYIWPPVVSLHLPDGVASRRITVVHSCAVLLSRQNRQALAQTSAFLRNLKTSRNTLFVCKAQMHCLIRKSAEYLSPPWDLLFLEHRPSRKRRLPQVPSNCDEFTELNGFTINLHLCKDGA